MEDIARKEAYYTVKDHKKNWKNRTENMLVNPAISELGRVSKVILQRINKELRERLGVKQIISTQEAIKWFEDIKEKDKKSLLQFDIEKFYPSITEDLMEKAFKLAKEHTYIEDSSVDVIRASSRSILFLDGVPWKKIKNPEADTTIGSYDGAERAELVGLYLLWLLTINHDTKVAEKEDILLYRDDGLAV